MLSPISNSSVVRVGIIRTSSIGDVVLATSCLDLLSQLDIPTKVQWLGRQPSLSLISAFYPEVETIEFSDQAKKDNNERLYKRMSENHFIVDLQRNIRSHLLCRSLEKVYDIPVFTYNKAGLARTKEIWTARLRGRSRLLGDQVRQPKSLQYERMIGALKAGLAWHLPSETMDLIHPLQAVPRLPVEQPEEPPSWLKEISVGRWIAIAPGASYETKRAPLEFFRSVCESLEKRLEQRSEQIGIVFVGDGNDRPLATSLLDKINWPFPTINLAGKLSLVESALTLDKVDVLLSNDSSLSHIAEAVGTPALVLFGPTVESFGFAPRMKQSHAFSTALGCRPCSKHGKTPCRFGDKRCFSDIHPNDVITRLESLALDEAMQ